MNTNAQTISNLTLRQILVSFAYLAYCGEQITTPNPEQAIPKIPPLTQNGERRSL